MLWQREWSTPAHEEHNALTHSTKGDSLKNSLSKHNIQNISNYSMHGLVLEIHKEFFCALHVLNIFSSWKKISYLSSETFTSL